MTTYPPEVASLQLNLLGSHDTPRFISLAGGDATALRLATLIQMTLPGVPCIYYGDEVGLEGREDPDCRRAYPWDPARQDRGLRDFIAGLISVRRANPVLRRGRFELLASEGSAVAYGMFGAEDPSGPSILVAVNAGDAPARLSIEHPGPAGHLAEQVSWPGREWGTTFAPRLLERGPLVVELEAREGVAIGAASIL
jgi:glycosidase